MNNQHMRQKYSLQGSIFQIKHYICSLIAINIHMRYYQRLCYLCIGYVAIWYVVLLIFKRKMHESSDKVALIYVFYTTTMPTTANYFLCHFYLSSKIDKEETRWYLLLFNI
jgi:hypothetical protein